MKNAFLTTGLILALVCVNQIWAQNDSQLTTQSQSEIVEVAEVESTGSGISVEIEVDDSKADAESLDRLTAALRDIAGEDVAQEVVIELNGLSDEEKAELVKKIRKGLKFDGSQVPGWVGVVAILGVILIFGFPILILIAVFVYLARKRRQKMNVIQVYLDAGKDVPAELLKTFDNGGSSFRSGLTLTFVGLGIVAAFNAANESSIGALGLIPMFLGLAKLLYWYVEERNTTKA